jgi:hypothetical protein
MYLTLLSAPSPRVYWASNINKYQEMFLKSKARPSRKADNLAAIYGPIVYKMWVPRYLTTL